jgi:hypothetical protein
MRRNESVVREVQRDRRLGIFDGVYNLEHVILLAQARYGIFPMKSSNDYSKHIGNMTLLDRTTTRTL